MISTRPKSPTRAETIARALKPGPVYCAGVLMGTTVERRMSYLNNSSFKTLRYITIESLSSGNWVEDRTECPKSGTFYFPPKEEIDYEQMKPESRQPDFRLNKLNSLQGSVQSIIRHDSHEGCGNFTSTNDLVYNHLPKPLCGPNQRYYKRGDHQFYPQPDLLKCFGNITEWGLRKYKQYEWACTDVSDYMSTLFEDTFVPPRPDQYLHRCERLARNSSFTKEFRYKMTKPKSTKKQ